MNQKCPSCGNIVGGKKKATFARKMTRGAVKKGGMEVAGAAIGTVLGGPAGTLVGGALGLAAGALMSDTTNQIADELYDATVDEIEYEFSCPKCGRKWTKKVNPNLQEESDCNYQISDNSNGSTSRSYTHTPTRGYSTDSDKTQE